MSIKGFSVNGAVQRYDYTALDNLPQGQGVSDDLKAALLQLAQKVAYIDDQGQTYYDDLYDALYPEKTLLSIAANFQQGQAVVYNTDSLDSLKQYLTVTAIYDDASTETVPSSAYTLSGTLTTGTSVITVSYGGKTTTFTVTVDVGGTLLFQGTDRRLWGKNNTYKILSNTKQTVTGAEGQITDDGIRIKLTDTSRWNISMAPDGNTSLFNTFGSLDGHTIRLVYEIEFVTSAGAPQVTATFGVVSTITGSRLKYGTAFDINGSEKNSKEFVFNSTFLSDGSGSYNNNSYATFHCYVSGGNGMEILIKNLSFYDLGVLN